MGVPTMKIYDILLKSKAFESLGSGFVISGKKKCSVLDMAHGDPIFAQVGPIGSTLGQKWQKRFTSYQSPFCLPSLA